jgi:hypothetical protein
LIDDRHELAALLVGQERPFVERALALTRLTEPNGPTRAELATAVKRIMKFPKIGAFGLRILIRKEMLTGK